MELKYAKKLHNGDQITVKETKEVTDVQNTECQEKDVWVFAMTSEGYSRLHHTEIS